ncbi:hypothetical protein Tco_0129970, partial [Tanacetum coccineum]
RKTSLLRTIAGLWHTGKGKITFYAKYTGIQDLPRTPDVAPHEAEMVVKKNNLDKISKYRDFKESTPHNSKATGMQSLDLNL